MPRKPSHQQRNGFALLLLASTGYSFFSVFTHGIEAGGLPPLDTATWRYLFATPIIWVLVWLRRVPLPPKPVPRIWVLTSGPLMATAGVCAFYGLTLLPASVYLLIYYSYPASVALVSTLRGERLSRSTWIALVVTLIGVAVAAPNLSEGLQQGNALGMALALLNALVVALYFIVSSHSLRDYHDTPRATAWSVTGTLVALFLLVPFRTVMVPASLTVWSNLAGLVIVSTLIPVAALNAGIRRVGAVQASLLSMVEPVLALLAAFIFLGERLIGAQVIGGALILASVLFIQLQQVRGR